MNKTDKSPCCQRTYIPSMSGKLILQDTAEMSPTIKLGYKKITELKKVKYAVYQMVLNAIEKNKMERDVGWLDRGCTIN